MDEKWWGVLGVAEVSGPALARFTPTYGPFDTRDEAAEKTPPGPGRQFVQAKDESSAIEEAFRQAGIPYP